MKDKKVISPSNTEAEENQEVQVVKPQSKVKKVISTIINVILVLAIILAAGATYLAFVGASEEGSPAPSILGLRMLSVKTDSMYPTIKPGDLIFAVEVKNPSDLKVDDIITYWTVIDGKRALNTHRIHAIYDQDGSPLFATMGDNNPTADPLNVHQSNIVGKYIGRVSGVGKFIEFVQSEVGFLIVVVIPVFIFFLFYLVQFFSVLFEYQNVKNRIKYEQERGRTEDLLAEQQLKSQAEKEQERAAMEAELREKLKAELLASMNAEQAGSSETPTEE